MDLLRAAQREGFVRVERDRQGVIRVFQGAAAPERAREPQMAPAAHDEPAVDVVAPAPVLDSGIEELPGDNFGNVEQPVSVVTDRPRRRRTAPTSVPRGRARRPKKAD